MQYISLASLKSIVQPVPLPQSAKQKRWKHGTLAVTFILSTVWVCDDRRVHDLLAKFYGNVNLSIIFPLEMDYFNCYIEVLSKR